MKIEIPGLPELEPIHKPTGKSTGKRYYIAGPMTGYPLWNFPAFDAARDLLLDEGHEVISPADLDRERGFDGTNDSFPEGSFQLAIRLDTIAIMMSTGIYLLSGWERSVGAKFEHHVAKMYGVEIRYEDGAIDHDLRVTSWPQKEKAA